MMSMSIERDIGQPQFSNEHQKVMINLMYTNNYVVDRLNRLFKSHDITRQQYNVMRILRGQHPEPVTINLIKERMLDKMSDASRIVERLRIKGLVERKQSAYDRRSVEVTITESGLELLANMDPEARKMEGLLHNLSDDEAKQLNSLLDKIRG